jgi:quercetin dioxygenase-like cupin family protein
MADAVDPYTENPITGERFAFQTTDEDLVRLDWFLPPGGSSPVHVHPNQIERVAGQEGELTLSIDGETVKVEPGQVFDVPAGVPHLFRNDGEVTVHTQVDFIPALDIREFLEMTAGLAADGKLDGAGRPRNPLQFAVFVLGFRHVFHVARPPLWLQRLTLGPLAVLGRLIGYERYHPKYRRPTVEAESTPAPARAGA